MNTEEFKEFNKKVRSKGLVMSRIPEDIRERFVKLAADEFCDDFGMCFKFVFNQFEESLSYKQNFDLKLNYLISLIDSQSPTEEKPEANNGIKMLSGEKREKGGKK